MTASAPHTLLQLLQDRFERHRHRHPGVSWAHVRAKLDADPAALRSLQAMEATGGEPDVVCLDDHADAFTFCDFATESPVGRRSCCYDQEALDARKENTPAISAVAMAAGFRGVLRV